jgi:hypothetical protein
MVRNAKSSRGPTLHYERLDDWVFSVGVRINVCTRSTRALADESDAVRVTTKSSDVVADPFNGQALIL